MTFKQSTLFILTWTAILIIPLWGIVRAAGALFSRRLRSHVAAHPVIHAAWFFLSLCLIVAALVPLGPNTALRHFPTFYHHASGDFYWRIILHGSGREIAHRNGIIFFYLRGPHGPMFLGISEAEATRTRNIALRNLTDKIAFHYSERQNEPLVRAELLTQHHADTIDSFGEWWRQTREHFEFDAEANVRYRQLQWRKYKLDDRFRHYSDIEAREQERIARDYYRTDAWLLSKKRRGPIRPGSWHARFPGE